MKDAQDLAQFAKMVIGEQHKQRLGGEKEQAKHSLREERGETDGSRGTVNLTKVMRFFALDEDNIVSQPGVSRSEQDREDGGGGPSAWNGQ